MSFAERIELYEHGIEVIDDPPEGLRRLAIREKNSTDSGYTMTILGPDNSSLNRRALNLFAIPAPNSANMLAEENDVRACLLGALYYLNNIIEKYAEMVRLFEATYPESIAEGDCPDQRIFFDVFAFVNAGRHLFDLIAKLLWKHYARGLGAPWSRVETALTSREALPTRVYTTLDEVWMEQGPMLMAYRDYLTSAVLLTGTTPPTIWMKRFAGRWGATVRLPPTPYVPKDGVNISRPTEVDAATYCHSAVTKLVALCEEIMTQPEIRTTIANSSTNSRSIPRRE